MENKSFWTSPITIILIVSFVLCCCCLVLAAGGYGLFVLSEETSEYDFGTLPYDDEDFTFDPSTPTPVALDRTPIENVSLDTLSTLQNTIVPINDPRDLAERLSGVSNIPDTFPSGPFEVGASKDFWVTNVDTNENFQITATLRYVTPSTYFWIENGVNYNERELRDLAEAFDTKIYPTNREFFGPEPNPGIDEDERIYVLYASGLGRSLAGYFSSADAVHPLAHEYSNAHEMFLFNSDTVRFDEEFTYGVLAHEFQHMIHWYQDRNETSWLNEGFSELATLLNGYNAGGFDYAFIGDPDLQLNDWPNDSSSTTPHYGASFLFTAYFLDRFGDDATQALVRHPENGLDSVDAVLREINAIDPLTGELIQADEFFVDWVVANYLGDDRVSDGRYAYRLYSGAPQTSATETVSNCPSTLDGRTVKQYGTDYIKISCKGDFTLRFEGATQTRLLPASADAYSGLYAFWSNKGDESNMTLTREFDFSDVSGPLEISYQTWYDLEEDYDYLYLVASTDNAETWQIVLTPSGTAEDPSGNSYGWGYNGTTNAWIQETVDLSQFAGQKVLLRFEYVTDAAVNGEGLLLDDISIPAIDYFSDFESDDGGWQAAGFARVQNLLPQTFRLALIYKGKTIRIENIILPADQAIEIPLSIGGDVDEIILTVSGTTRFTREVGAYSVEIR
ncbi:MAG: immune inhibitor A [Anaerolineae bacterium]|nr:immune inhibitor A [Anaerolineae bacterium]